MAAKPHQHRLTASEMLSEPEPSPRDFRRYELIVLFIAAIVFLGCIVSPPSLQDDVDAVQATIARNMIKTGDWVTPQLDGVRYFEKPPLKYWMIAICYKLFGDHDYVARIPMALIAVLLCWITARFGQWAFRDRGGFFAGVILATCAGLFLFTRVLISDVALTFTITLAMWAFLRSQEEEEPNPKRWGYVFWASAGTGLLFKGLLGAIFPMATGFLYLVFTRRGTHRPRALFDRESWSRLVPLTGSLVFLAIAAPWHVMAAVRNPPAFYVAFTGVRSQYHGFFWFYFFNEHILRFLNRRYPRDYDTVPRLKFWLYHLLWLFPWSVYYPALFGLTYRGADRSARTRLLCLCWIGFLMFFFSLSSTQEYYSMPCYPAIALLIGSALASSRTNVMTWIKRGEVILLLICTLAAGAIAFLLARVWNLPTPGDISQALRQQETPAYYESLGHMGDLTISSFAYLRPPLWLAGVAFLVGVWGLFLLRSWRRYAAPAVMMVLFFHAVRLALVTFDPYLSSRPLAEAYKKAPPGEVMIYDPYWEFSSFFYYADTNGWLVNGRRNNLEYGSYAPGAPSVYLDDLQMARKWAAPPRAYLVFEGPAKRHIKEILGTETMFLIKESGGKFLISNRPVAFDASVLTPSVIR